MSLMGTLAKVAIGIAVAKGAGSLMNKSRGSSDNDGLFGGTHSSPRGQQKETGLEDMMGDIFGGKGQQSGGLGGLLEGLQNGTSGDAQNGGLDDLLRGQTQAGSDGAAGGLGGLLENLTGGKGGSGGGLGDLLGGLVGAAGGRTGNFGEVLNQSFERRGEPELKPTPEQDVAAGLMLRAMIQAAKSDGKIDEGERRKLLDNLGDISPQERDFVQHEMSAPVDVQGLAHQVPRGLEQQVYAMSVMGIDLDNQNEARYLHSLATAMKMDRNTVNRIHDRMGAPAIYQ